MFWYRRDKSSAPVHEQQHGCSAGGQGITKGWLLHDFSDDVKRFYADELLELQLADVNYLGGVHGQGVEGGAMSERLTELKAKRKLLSSDQAREQAVDKLSTRDVVDFLLKRRAWDELSDSERAAGTGNSLAELGSTKFHIGAPLYFVSHAWGNQIGALLSAVGSHLVAASDDTRVWLDFVALNQFARGVDVDLLETRIKVCSGGTIVAMALKPCNPAERAWCVLEWDRTLAVHGYEGLHVVVHGEPGQRAQLLHKMDVANAQCSSAEDKAAVMRKVQQQHGSAGAFDAALKLQLLLKPLSCKVDLQQLRGRSRGAQWRWEAVETWLHSDKRVLCILGEAASGKSTVSAALAPARVGAMSLCAMCIRKRGN
jgi:hypothetical protein